MRYWLALCWVACSFAATDSAEAAKPHSFKGTITITAFMSSPGRKLLAGESSNGTVRFKGIYHVHGTRAKGRGIPKNTYALVGSGTENLSADKHDVQVNGCAQKDFTLNARASGSVALKKGALGPRQTDPLFLTLLPHGRYTVNLGSLEGDTDGVPLTYQMRYSENSSCPNGTNKNWNYDKGLMTSSDGDRSGIAQSQSIWGMGVWRSFGHPSRPDLCHERLVGHDAGALLCGRLHHGKASDSISIPPSASRQEWDVDDPPFYPWDVGGLTSPGDDGIYDMPNLDIGWIEVMAVDYSLKPS
jgi:hypothetical protein